MRVGRRLREAGFEALFVGGCVRDALLGSPVKDVDVATNASPSAVEKIFRRTIPVGEAFGVMIVVDRGEPVEVATFRKESGYANRRHPTDVQFGSAEEDVKRRDFTVNGLFYDFDSGEVVDYVGGLRDLEGRVLRAIGTATERFDEDALRLMRAVRFAGKHNLRIEDDTWEAIKSRAPLIREISRERVGEEWGKALESAPAAFYLHFMARSGLLELTLPEVAALEPLQTSLGESALETTVRRLGLIQRALRREAGVLPLIEQFPPTDEQNMPILWAGLLFEIGRPRHIGHERDLWEGDAAARAAIAMMPALGHRLAWSVKLREFVIQRLERAGEFHRFPELPLWRQRELLGHPDAPADVLLLAAYREVFELSAQPLKTIADLLERFSGRDGAEPLLPPPLVDGEILMREGGLKPGPLVGKLLKEIRREQLEGKLKSAKEALTWISKEAN
jgi:tRNA nucleotidyltransferase/poly(A) polymerase